MLKYHIDTQLYDKYFSEQWVNFRPWVHESVSVYYVKTVVCKGTLLYPANDALVYNSLALIQYSRNKTPLRIVAC